MIQRAKHADLTKLTELVSTYQLDREYSGYMRLDRTHIQKDLETAIANQCVLMVWHKEQQGALIGHCDKKRAVCDLAGPYVHNHNLELGIALIKHWIALYPEVYVHQFFFNRHSSYYQTIMDNLNAHFQGYESILRLDRKAFVSQPKDARVTPMHPRQKEAVEQLHTTIFPNAYLDAQTLTAIKKDQTVYVICEDTKVIGYGLMKIHGSQASLEVFAIAEAYRGKQLSKPLIQTMIHETLQDTRIKTVQLVVENINDVALNLYRRIGFTLYRENSSYHLQSQSVSN